MKKFKILLLFFSFMFITAYALSQYKVLNESSKEADFSAYKNIYLGWLDLNEADAGIYGFKEGHWKTEIRRHNIDGLQIYFRDLMPGYKITGAKSRDEKYPGNSDLQIQFKLTKKIKYEVGFLITCEMPLDVVYIDGKSGKVLSASSVMVTCHAPFPRNWKSNSFDGALDNDVYNLAKGLAARIKPVVKKKVQDDE